MCRLVFIVNLTQPKAPGERKPQLKNCQNPISLWPCLSCLMDVGGPSPLWAASAALDGQVGLGCVKKKKSWQRMSQRGSKQNSSMSPFLTSVTDGPGSVCQITIPSPKLLLCVYHSIRKQSSIVALTRVCLLVV